jgi:hypothetical protein
VLEFPEGEVEISPEIEGVAREVLDDLAVTGVLWFVVLLDV